MRTQRIAHLDIDRQRLVNELEVVSSFEFSRAYSDYVCGGPWLSCMLWTVGGESGAGFISEYDYAQAAKRTDSAGSLPYLCELVESTFHLDKLNFARLAVLRPGSVIIPHRDLLEVGKLLHRVHIPLITDDDCFFTEQNTVFRMRFGEVWLFDAAAAHSAACFSDRDRVHLMLDFASDAASDEIFRIPYERTKHIAADSVLDRPALNAEERAALSALAQLLDIRNHRDIMSLVIKQHYRKDGGDDFIWKTLLQIAERAPDRAAAQRIQDLHRFFLVHRAAGERA